LRIIKETLLATAARRDLERSLRSPRRVLYMLALVAIRDQPNMRAFYEHLRAGRKAKMGVLVAVIMRKLLHAIFGMFKHQQKFDGSKLFPSLHSRCPPRRPPPNAQKASCTFKRKITLEIRERIYQLEFRSSTTNLLTPSRLMRFRRNRRNQLFCKFTPRRLH
jgi:hypothetical protein